MELHDQRNARGGKVTLGVRFHLQYLFSQFCLVLGTRSFLPSRLSAPGLWFLHCSYLTACCISANVDNSNLSESENQCSWSEFFPLHLFSVSPKNLLPFFFRNNNRLLLLAFPSLSTPPASPQVIIFSLPIIKI